MMKNNQVSSYTILQVLADLAKVLYKADPTHQAAYYDVKARMIVEQVIKANLIIRLHTSLSDQELEQIEHILKDHLKKHKPLAYCFGSVDFLSLRLTIQPPVLIPRAETEAWVAQLIERFVEAHTIPLSILDLCTGSGAIALAFAHAFIKSIIVGVDNNPQALRLARANKDRYKAHHVSFIQSDLYEELSDTFALIVANPPYISHQVWQTLDRSVRAWEDPYALYAADNGLALIKKIILQAPAYVSSTTYELYKQKNLPNVVIEIGYDQAATVQELLCRVCAHNIIVHKDNASHDRWVEALITPRQRI